MGVPQLRRLPVHRSNEGADHRSGRLLDFCEAKVGDLGDALGGDEDVGGFAVAVDDGGFAGVEVGEAVGDVEHDAQLKSSASQRRTKDDPRRRGNVRLCTA